MLLVGPLGGYSTRCPGKKTAALSGAFIWRTSSAPSQIRQITQNPGSHIQGCSCYIKTSVMKRFCCAAEHYSTVAVCLLFSFRLPPLFCSGEDKQICCQCLLIDNNWLYKQVFTAPYFPNGVFVLLTVAHPGNFRQLESATLTQTHVWVEKSSHFLPSFYSFVERKE